MVENIIMRKYNLTKNCNFCFLVYLTNDLSNGGVGNIAPTPKFLQNSK